MRPPQKWITRTRRLFDRALTSLPVTQHERVWPLYLRFIGQPGIPVETAVRVGGPAAWLRAVLAGLRGTPAPAAACWCRLPLLPPAHPAPPPPPTRPPTCLPTPPGRRQVYRRYLKLEPAHAEEFIAYLKIQALWGEAAKVGGRGPRGGGGRPVAGGGVTGGGELQPGSLRAAGASCRRPCAAAPACREPPAAPLFKLAARVPPPTHPPAWRSAWRGW